MPGRLNFFAKKTASVTNGTPITLTVTVTDTSSGTPSASTGTVSRES